MTVTPIPISTVNFAGANRLRVLVVEDDRSTARSMRMLLEYHGYIVDVAGTIAEAMQRVGEATYTVALLDLMLPDGHGCEIFDWLRDNSPSTQVTILTGCADVRINELLKSIDPEAVMKKPVDFCRILERICAA